MKPTEGRRRIVIEEVQPTVDNGRYPAKRILGDTITVTAASFGDGHDHLAARLLYRHHAQRRWSSVPFAEINNDLWSATFSAATPDDTAKLGLWHFTLEAWIDHFDTWVHDLTKRLAAQSDSAQDIPLVLRIGATHLDAAASRAKGVDRKNSPPPPPPFAPSPTTTFPSTTTPSLPKACSTLPS
jgi:starch synthase (maltosyl-transferring)